MEPKGCRLMAIDQASQVKKLVMHLTIQNIGSGLFVSSHPPCQMCTLVSLLKRIVIDDALEKGTVAQYYMPLILKQLLPLNEKCTHMIIIIKKHMKRRER